MKKKFFLLTLIVTMMLLVVACTKDAQDTNADNSNGDASNEVAGDYPPKTVTFVAPGGAGGGWDTTIRSVAKALKDANLTTANLPVKNVEGAGGSIFLAQMQEDKTADDTLVVYSSPLLLTKLAGTTDLNHENTTPIANLIADYAAFVVKADSEYENINDLMDALKSDIKSVKIGGASSAGSMDHIQFLTIANAAGIEDLKEIDYISFDEGANAQLLGGHIDVLSTGLSEVKALVDSGDFKVLAQTSDKTIFDIPSAKEQGIDATFINWRGIFGPEEMPDYAVEYWSKKLAELRETDEWKAMCEQYGWDDYYVAADEYASFLDERNEEFKTILEKIGMLN